MTKTAAVINDLSGLGRCSLTAALPVLSALGIQACPVPTAVLTAQTGFAGYHLEDLTCTIDCFIDHWRRLEMRFDGISTGFLSSAAQADGVARFLDAFAGPDTLVLVDPVMGDDGMVYPGYDEPLQQRVRALVRRADVVTPNLTEACLLTGQSYAALEGLSAPALFDTVEELARQIAATGPQVVAITGIRRDGRIHNLTLDHGRCALISADILGGSYSGTGDLFAAVLHGCLLRGADAGSAARLAADFLCAALRDTVPQGTDRNQGVAFEPHLGMLTGAALP